MNDVIISLQDVGISYRIRKSFFRHTRFDALNNVSFELRRGETLGVIGRNGAGKSSLLKLLSGIYEPDRGVIVNKATKTSLLSLQAGFDPNLSGRDNAIVSGMLLGYSREQSYSQLELVKEYSDLKDFFYEPIKTYSTGMRARLGFAVASYMTPEILLVDEVLGVGDVKFATKARATIESMIRSDQTVVLVSHSINKIKSLCNKALWLDQGTMKMFGSVDDVLDAYLEMYGDSVHGSKKVI